jgi:nucleoid DNA-binding protein
MRPTSQSSWPVAVSGIGYARPEYWSPWLDLVADDAGLLRHHAAEQYKQMATVIIKAIAKGDTFAVKGIGQFMSRKRQRRAYRNWRTGILKIAPASTLPICRTSPTLRAWLKAAALPDWF